MLRQIAQRDDQRAGRPVQARRDATRSVSRGVAIDYYLKQAADKVTIEILDAQGKVHQTFTGTPPRGRRTRRPRRAAGARPDEEGGGRGGPPARVAVKQGMNRFIWDMRYPDAQRLSRADHVGRQRARPGGAARDSTRCG